MTTLRPRLESLLRPLAAAAALAFLTLGFAAPLHLHIGHAGHAGHSHDGAASGSTSDQPCQLCVWAHQARSADAPAAAAAPAARLVELRCAQNRLLEPSSEPAPLRPGRAPPCFA